MSHLTQNSFNGIATLPVVTADDDAGFASASPVVTKLDYAGSAANGHMDIKERLVVASSQYSAGGAVCIPSCALFVVSWF